MLHTPTPQEIRPQRQRKKKHPLGHWPIFILCGRTHAYLRTPWSTCERFNMMRVQEDVLRISSLQILGGCQQSSDGADGSSAWEVPCWTTSEGNG